MDRNRAAPPPAATPNSGPPPRAGSRVHSRRFLPRQSRNRRHSWGGGGVPVQPRKAGDGRPIPVQFQRFDRSAHKLLYSPVPSEGFPSGQREQTVNLPALPSKVRILPPPPPQRLSVTKAAAKNNFGRVGAVRTATREDDVLFHAG